MIERKSRRLERAHQVHVEQVAPDLARSPRRAPDGLFDRQYAGRSTGVPLGLRLVDRVGLRHAFDLENHQPAGFAATLSVLLGDRQDPDPPVRSSDEEAVQGAVLLIALPAGEAERLGLGFQVHGHGRQPEAEALIDGALGRPKHREGLSATMTVVDHQTHHLAHQPSPAVRRQDRDPRDSAGRQLPARHGQAHREDPARGDETVAIQSGEEALLVRNALDAADQLVRNVLAERHLRGLEQLGEPLGRADSNVDTHGAYGARA